MQHDGFYIGTLNQCSYYQQKVATAEGFNTTDGDGTTKWAEIKQHPTDPNLYAVEKHIRHTHSSMQLLTELDASWDIQIEE